MQKRVSAYEALVREGCKVNSRLLLIPQLIPIGLLVIKEELQSEVSRLTEIPYSRG